MPIQWDRSRPPTRCHWYYSDGSKRMQRNGDWGCTHPACLFIHPEHSKWAEAKPTHHPNAEGEKKELVRRDRATEKERTRSERDVGRTREPREYEREREGERERGRDREHDSLESPPRAGPSTPTGPNMPSSTYASSRDPRMRSSASLSSFTAPPISSTNSTQPRASTRLDSPSKPGAARSIPRRDSMSRPDILSATPMAMASPSLSRSDTVVSRTTSVGGRDSLSNSYDRGPFYDRDKERDRDRDQDKYRDRSPSSTTSPEPRSRVVSSSLRHRQESGAATLAPQSSRVASTSRSPAPNAMVPPPPKLSLQATAALPAVPLPGPLSAPLPARPSSQGGIKAEASASKPSPTRQDKLQIWADRIKGLAEAVQTRMQHVAAERELAGLRALTNSRQYANISESAQEKMEKKLKGAEERFAQKKSELNDRVYKLVDNDFWDAPLSWQSLRDETKVDTKGKGKEKEPSWDSQESNGEERFRELRTVVWQTRDAVTELHKMLDEARRTSSSTPPAGAPSGVRETSEDKRPVKRRRTSGAAVEGLASTAPSSTLFSTSAPSEVPSVTVNSALPTLPGPPVEMEEITDRLAALDDRVNDIENTMVQFDSEVLSELEFRIEERFREMKFGIGLASDESMDVEQTHGADPGRSGGGEAPQNPHTLSQRLQNVEQEVQGAGKEIYQIAVEIAEMIKKSQSQENEVARLSKENEELKARISTMEKQHLEHRESLQTFKAEMGALNAALQAYISRPTSPPSAPPAPPVVPDMQYIADTIRPMVLESIRNDVRPLLEDLTIEVQQMITRQNTQVAQSLMNKLQLTLKTVEVIYNWMNRTAAAQVQLAAPPPAAASPLVSQNAIATNGHGSNGLSSPAVGTSIVDATNHRGASPVVPVTTAFIR